MTHASEDHSRGVSRALVSGHLYRYVCQTCGQAYHTRSGAMGHVKRVHVQRHDSEGELPNNALGELHIRPDKVEEYAARRFLMIAECFDCRPSTDEDPRLGFKYSRYYICPKCGLVWYNDPPPTYDEGGRLIAGSTWKEMKRYGLTIIKKKTTAESVKELLDGGEHARS